MSEPEQHTFPTDPQEALPLMVKPIEPQSSPILQILEPNSTCRTNPPSTGFLDLPREIRDLIYREALTSRTGVYKVTPSNHSKHQTENLRRFHAVFQEYGMLRDFIRRADFVACGPSLNLLATSRQVLCEAEPYFWKCNIFFFTSLNSYWKYMSVDERVCCEEEHPIENLWICPNCSPWNEANILLKLGAMLCHRNLKLLYWDFHHYHVKFGGLSVRVNGKCLVHINAEAYLAEKLEHYEIDVDLYLPYYLPEFPDYMEILLKVVEWPMLHLSKTTRKKLLVNWPVWDSNEEANHNAAIIFEGAQLQENVECWNNCRFGDLWGWNTRTWTEDMGTAVDAAQKVTRTVRVSSHQKSLSAINSSSSCPSCQRRSSSVDTSIDIWQL